MCWICRVTRQESSNGPKSMNELLLRVVVAVLLAVPTRAPVTLAEANEQNFFSKGTANYETHGYSWLNCPIEESIPTFTLHQVKKSWVEVRFHASS